MASKASLLSSDLRVRAHGIVAMADAALREAERAGATITALRLLRGKAAGLKQAMRGVPPAAAVVTDDQRASMESDYRRAVALFESASTPTAVILSLETLRSCWETLWRATPAPGAQQVTWGVSLGEGYPVEFFTFWSNDPAVLNAKGSIELQLHWPRAGGPNDGN